MSDFIKYRRSQIAELRPFQLGDNMTDVSVSTEDRKAGSPKLGDMIARNPKNHDDQWLVAAQYFADNFEPDLSIRSTPTGEGATFDGDEMEIATSSAFHEGYMAGRKSALSTPSHAPAVGDLEAVAWQWQQCVSGQPEVWPDHWNDIEHWPGKDRTAYWRDLAKRLPKEVRIRALVPASRLTALQEEVERLTDLTTAMGLATREQAELCGEEAARANAAEAEVDRLREALRGMLQHSCVADAHPEDKDAEDHDAERVAREALRTTGDKT